MSIPDARACYPLNRFFETGEMNNKQPPGFPGEVSLTTGPNADEGGSYQFHGNANSYIEFPNVQGGLDISNSITWLFWLYLDNAVNAPVLQYGGKLPVWGAHIWTKPDGWFANFHQRDYTPTKSVIINQPLEINQWHHVGASYDSKTGTTSLWLNGERVAQQNIGVITIATQDNVSVGVMEGHTTFLTGRITAIQFYDGALTAEQIDRVKKFGLGEH